jgi:hypothetical protein
MLQHLVLFGGGLWIFFFFFFFLSFIMDSSPGKHVDFSTSGPVLNMPI